MDKSQSTASSLEESLGDDTTRRLSSAAIMTDDKNEAKQSLIDLSMDQSKTESTDFEEGEQAEVEGEEDDEEEDDDIEPKLNYNRVDNDVGNVFKTDSITCLTLYDRYFAVGTQSGQIFIFDFQGNLWTGGRFKLHPSSVEQISIEDKGEFIGSCSNRRLVITEIYTRENIYVGNTEAPVKSFYIDPNYASSGSKRFVVGEADQLLLYEKNIIGRYKSNCLQRNRGVIRAITWRTHFIAWASDLGIKIYDVQSRQIITHIDRDKDPNETRIKADLFQCAFCWKDNLTLLLAWGHSVKMCCIKLKTGGSELSLATSSSSSDKLPKYYVELVYAYSIERDLVACGIAPFENKLIILCINKSVLVPTFGEDAATSSKNACRVKMIEPLNVDMFNDISDDLMQPKEFLKTVTSSRNVAMTYLKEENFYFIVCPKDLILAKAREENDHINWLLSRAKFREAMDRVRYNIERKCYQQHTIESVGLLFIQHLLTKGTPEAVEEAAQLCRTVCGSNQEQWEKEVVRFKQCSALKSLANHVPLGPEVILKPAFYELILNEFLKTDFEGYLQLIRAWPSNIYSTEALIKATIDQLSVHSHDRHLLEALGELYVHAMLYQKALFIFLQVENAKKVFELIYQHQLLHLLEDRIVQLLQLDAEETSRLLILNQDSIPAPKVVSRLSDHPRLLCAYLDRLVHRDPVTCASYHDLLFSLYTTYEPNKLIPFLRQSSYIKLESALQLCRAKNLTKVVVFILGRMGRAHEALRLIINQMNDIESAIDFCKEQNDLDLWAELMDISVSKPELLSILLREVSTYATDPIGLISRIPEGLEVPNLMPLLVKILQDYRLQVTLEDGCRKVLHTDCYNLMQRNVRMRSRALVGGEKNSLCQGCQRTIFAFDQMFASDVILFQCGHVFHRICLLADDIDNIDTTKTDYVCVVCNVAQ